MLARLVQLSLSQRLFVLLATLIVAGAGWMAYLGLPIDAFPDVSSTQVKIIMKAPGMTPGGGRKPNRGAHRSRDAGHPEKRKMLRSVSKYGIVDVTIDFEDGTDIYWARQQVSRALVRPRRRPARPASAAAWRRSPRRWARCSCSPSRVKACRWKNGAACWTG
jgi:cobalt-zinc-cadmium resistance protein CzcA